MKKQKIENKKFKAFDNSIKTMIEKDDPINNRRRMKEKLVDYCKKENKATIEEIIYALIEYYEGEIYAINKAGEIISLIYALICCGATIIVSAIVSISNIDFIILAIVYGAIFMLAAGALLVSIFRRRKGKKIENDAYILSFLNNCISDKKQLKKIKQKVNQKLEDNRNE